MSSYLCPLQALGLQVEAHHIDQLMAEGIPEERLPDEILRRFGTKPGEPDGAGQVQAVMTLAELRIRELLATPRPRGYPPRVFVSYRRATAAAVTRARSVATALREAGYRVLWDGFEGDLSDWQRLGRFLGEVASADICVALVSRDYVEQDGGVRDWIFEEFSRIDRLYTLGLAELVYVLEPDAGSEGTGYPLQRVDSGIAVVDARTECDVGAKVIELLGPYEGPVFSEEDESRLGLEAAACLSLCAQEEGEEAEERFRHLRAEFSATEEFALIRCETLRVTGCQGAATSSALEALARHPSLPTAYELANVLWRLDAHRQAFAVLSDLVFQPSAWQARIMWLMADILRREGAFHSSANYYRWFLGACVPVWTTDAASWRGPALGYLVYTLMRVGNTSAAEFRGLAQQLDALSPESRAGLPVPSEVLLDEVQRHLSDQTSRPVEPPAPECVCPHCDARTPEDAAVCMHCGAIFPCGTGALSDCSMCASTQATMLASSPLPWCPVCRRLQVPEERLVEAVQPGLLEGRLLSLDGISRTGVTHVNLMPRLREHRTFVAPRYATGAREDGRWWLQPWD